jgi:hypothetical protein
MIDEIISLANEEKRLLLEISETKKSGYDLYLVTKASSIKTSQVSLFSIGQFTLTSIRTRILENLNQSSSFKQGLYMGVV